MTRFVDVTDPDVPDQTGYGLGLRRLVIDGHELWGHTGTIPGFGAVAVYWPKADATLAVISNLSVFDSVGVLRELVSAIRPHATNRGCAPAAAGP